MDRAEIMAAMGELKLYGMRAAYDELMAIARTATRAVMRAGRAARSPWRCPA